MPSPDDEMSIREIGRTLADFRLEFRSQIGQLLRADVYRAEQVALDVRIVSLEKDRDRADQERADDRRAMELERAANRRQVLGAFITSALSLVVGIILAVAR